MAAEGNVQFAFVEFVGVCLPFLDFQIVEARAEHLHGYLTILALTTLRLTRNDDVRGDVRDAHSGLHLVDVLATFATGTERVHAKILGPDIDFDAVVDLGNHEDGRKRSMAARGLIEGRNPHETMNAGFARKETVSIFTGKLDRRRLDAGFFSGSLIKNLGRHSPAFRPSQVHTEKDGSPILRFRPARAGLDGHDGVEVIGFSGKQRPGFQFGDVRIRGAKLAVQFFQQIVLLLDVGFFLGKMDVRLNVAGEGGEFRVRGNLFFGALALAEYALRRFLIVPEIGVSDAFFENFQALAVLRRVKDSSARA